MSNNIWTVPLSSLVVGQTLASSQFTRRNGQLTPDAGTLNSIASFGLDQTGNLYIVGIDGELFVIEPAP